MTNSLDCEDGQLAVESLATIFNCKCNKLEAILKSIEIEPLYNKEIGTPEILPETYLYNHVTEKLGQPSDTDRICWFHFTRTLRSNMFEDGILPLSKSLDKIWETLFCIFANSEVEHNLKNLRKICVNNLQYQLRANNPMHSGPYAILVKSVAFYHQRFNQHNYLDLPEIIDDICGYYLDTYGISIFDSLKKALSPCIVKFYTEENANQSCIEPARYYAYTHVNAKPVSWSSSWCFDAKNETIHHSNIIGVIFVGGAT